MYVHTCTKQNLNKLTAHYVTLLLNCYDTQIWNKYLMNDISILLNIKVAAVVSRLITRVMNKINRKTLTTRDMEPGWHRC